MKISDYKILVHQEAHELAKMVQAAINDGWQPFGSVASTPEDDGYYASFAQPVVKYQL